MMNTLTWCCFLVWRSIYFEDFILLLFLMSLFFTFSRLLHTLFIHLFYIINFVPIVVCVFKKTEEKRKKVNTVVLFCRLWPDVVSWCYVRTHDHDNSRQQISVWQMFVRDEALHSMRRETQRGAVCESIIRRGEELHVVNHVRGEDHESL